MPLFRLWEECRQQQKEDAWPHEAELVDLIQKEIPATANWEKEATAYTCAILSYGTGTYTSCIARTWTV